MIIVCIISNIISICMYNINFSSLWGVYCFVVFGCYFVCVCVWSKFPVMIGTKRWICLLLTNSLWIFIFTAVVLLHDLYMHWHSSTFISYVTLVLQIKILHMQTLYKCLCFEIVFISILQLVHYWNLVYIVHTGSLPLQTV